MDDSDSDPSDIDECVDDDGRSVQPVELGFCKMLDEYNSARLLPHFFPLGKVGGRPSWLAYRPLPDVEHMLMCEHCQTPMCFLLQVYAPSATAAHAFHRTLYAFVCRTPTCSRKNDATNMRMLRCQLPQINDFHPSENPPNFDEDGPDVRPDKELTDFSTLCAVCGCLAEKRCGKCERARYCSRSHQALHWRAGHKLQCGNDTPLAECAKTEWLFDEFELYLHTEVLYSKSSKDKSEAERFGEYQEFLTNNADQLSQFSSSAVPAKNGHTKNSPNDAADDGDKNSADFKALAKRHKDYVFDHFQSVISQNPTQVLRYQRNGIPLSARAQSEASPAPCELCGAARTFEFQITPHILSLLNVDSIGESLDWATVLVYTCSGDCDTRGAYVREVLIKQDYD